MKMILSHQHLSVLLRWAMSDTLMAFDFDGTLAPIVEEPEDAQMNTPTWRALDRLAETAQVAVVSGRSRASLLARLPASVRYIVGNHGNEGMPGHDPDLAAQSRICQIWQRQLEETVARTPELAGIRLENKGATLSVHHRACTHAQALARLLDTTLPGLQPSPRLIQGIHVMNVLPPRAWTKREALAALMHDARCDHMIFAGDDVTDELAFANAPDNWLTIRVGLEGPSQARFRVRHTADVSALLQRLHALRCQPTGPAQPGRVRRLLTAARRQDSQSRSDGPSH